MTKERLNDVDRLAAPHGSSQPIAAPLLRETAIIRSKIIRAWTFFVTVDLLRHRRVTDLVVLREQSLSPNAWRRLGRLAKTIRLRLSMVVHGVALARRTWPPWRSAGFAASVTPGPVTPRLPSRIQCSGATFF